MSNPYLQDPAFQALYDALGSRNLVPPATARNNRKGTGKNWTETFEITGLTVESSNARPEATGDDVYTIAIRLKVAPESQYQDEPSPNIGREITSFCNINLDAFMRAKGQRTGQAMGTEISLRNLKSLALACGLEPEAAMDPRAFANERAGEVIGNKVQGMVSTTLRDGNEFMNIGSFFVEED